MSASLHQRALRTLGPAPRKLVLPALLALVCQSATAALPATGAGALDPTFNAGAPLIRSMSPKYDMVASVAYLADGKVLAAGFANDPATYASAGYVSRLLPDGTPDPAYGTGGTFRFGTPTVSTVSSALHAMPDGSAVVAGYSLVAPDAPLSLANTPYEAWFARVTPDGRFDAAFGVQGRRTASCAPNPRCYYTGTGVQADGRLVMMGVTYDPNVKSRTTMVDRYLPDGSVDTSFGSIGRTLFPASLLNFEPYAMAIDAVGRIVVTGQVNNPGATPDEGVVARLTADGALDTGFGAGGLVRMSIAGLGTDFRGVAIQADGKIVIAATTSDPKVNGRNSLGRVVRLRADGSADPAFGIQGVADVVLAYGSSIGVQSDGRIVFGGSSAADDSHNKGLVARLLPDGRLDAAFGAGGSMVPPTEGWLDLGAMAIAPDDRVTLGGNADVGQYWDSALVRVIGTETTTTVTEFYNSTLNHYFITANPDEATAIDNGAAGPGWSRTGEAWKSGGPSRVCRFYGSPDLDPATGQRRGPNGHFYTISEEECALVKTDAGWKFESYDFSGWKPAANGSCAAGTRAVKRAYNNRFAVNDSNHRYATSDAVYNAMLAAGWTGEGTVFCAPL